MLRALYDYAVRNGLTLPAGYVNKTVKAYVLLYSDGSFQGVELGDDEAIPSPDIGSMANARDKSNVILEKRSIVIPQEETAKSRFFLSALKDAAQTEPRLEACVKALESPETLAAINKCLDDNGIKISDRVTFKVDMHSVLKGDKLAKWWVEYRKQFVKSSGGKLVPCLISGELISPAATTQPIKGLRTVGGHSSGDSLICFDKSAFCSYGFKQGANAPVSEEAFSAVKAALDQLLQDAPILAKMKFVHWYDCDVPRAEDPIVTSGDFFGLSMESEDEAEDEDSEGAEDPTVADPSPSPDSLIREKQASELVRSAGSGKQLTVPETARYYILLLTGVGGRVMIRRYDHGNYAVLQERLNQWHDDLSLVNANGNRELPSFKLTARLMRLLKNQKSDSKVFERLANELSGLTPAIWSSVLSGMAIPDAVATRALAFIRSKITSDEDGISELFGKDICVWQWLKVWLLRKDTGKKGMLMKEYNPDYQGVAYHCGAMMAVYERIQSIAMPEVKATVIQRFYAAAIQTPALVLGRLSQMSVHHIEKIESKYLRDMLQNKLAEISTSVSGKIPATLNLEQQSEFALGYYQMKAELNREKQEMQAARKEADKAEKEEIK